MYPPLADGVMCAHGLAVELRCAVCRMCQAVSATFVADGAMPTTIGVQLAWEMPSCQLVTNLHQGKDQRRTVDSNKCYRGKGKKKPLILSNQRLPYSWW
jgi:hypothetical protein